jgi:hypothetical protein
VINTEKQLSKIMAAAAKQVFYDQLDEAERPSETTDLLGFKTSTGEEFYDVMLVSEDRATFTSQVESNQRFFSTWIPSVDEDDMIRSIGKRQKSRTGAGLAASSRPALPEADPMADTKQEDVEPETNPQWPRGQPVRKTTRAGPLPRNRDPNHPVSAKARLTGFDPNTTIPAGVYDPHAALRSLRFPEQGLPWPNQAHETEAANLLRVPYDDESLKVVKNSRGDVHIILSNFDIGKFSPAQIISAARDLNLPVNPTDSHYREGRNGDHFVSIPAPGMTLHLQRLFTCRVVYPAGVPMRISLGVHEKTDTSALLHLELTPSTQALTQYPAGMWPLKVEKILRRLTSVRVLLQPRQLDWDMKTSLLKARISVVCFNEADAASLLSNAQLGVMFGTFKQSGANTMRMDDSGRLVQDRAPGLFLVNVHGLAGVSYRAAKAHVFQPALKDTITGFRPFADRRPGRNGVFQSVNIYQIGFASREHQHACIKLMDGSTFNDRTCHYTLPRPVGRGGSCFRCHQMGHRHFECTARVCGTCYEDHPTSQCPITHPAVVPPAWQVAAASAPAQPRPPAATSSTRKRPPSTVRVLYDPRTTKNVRLVALPDWHSSDEDGSI